MNNKASILIVSRNNEDTLEKTVAASLAQDLPNHEYEVIVYDDVSGPAQRDLLKKLEHQYKSDIESGRFTIILNSEARGLSAGRNAIIKAAKYNILAMMDGDAFPEPDWLRHAIAAFDDPSVGIAASRVVFAGEPELTNGQGCTFSRYGYGIDRFVFQPVQNLPTESEEVLYAMGCGMLLRRAIWEQLGGFDESIGCGYDDSDFSLQAWIQGTRVVTAPKATVLHQTNSFDPVTRTRMLYNTQQRWRFMLKYWPCTWLLKAMVLQGGAIICTQDGRINSPVYLRAALSLLTKLPKILFSRKERPPKKLLERLMWEKYIPPDLYRDLHLLQHAPLTPVHEVSWNDAETFRLLGGFIRIGKIALINNGCCDIALFSACKTMKIHAEALISSDLYVSSSFYFSDMPPSTIKNKLPGNGQLSVDIPENAQKCRIRFSCEPKDSSPISPQPIIELKRVVQHEH